MVTRRAFTLIEMLAAAAILASVAAAGSVALQRAHRSAAESLDRYAAIEALHRCEAELASAGATLAEDEPWRGVDDRGRRWRVRLGSNGEPVDPAEDDAIDDAFPAFQRRTIVIERFDLAAMRFAPVERLTTLRLVEEEEDAP